MKQDIVLLGVHITKGRTKKLQKKGGQNEGSRITVLFLSVKKTKDMKPEESEVKEDMIAT